MYYRGANAAIICYDITSASSWNMVDSWLQELRRNMTTRLGISHVTVVLTYSRPFSRW